MGKYDLAGALAAGVPESEIVDFLSKEKNYNAQAARAPAKSYFPISIP